MGLGLGTVGVEGLGPFPVSAVLTSCNEMSAARTAVLVLFIAPSEVPKSITGALDLFHKIYCVNKHLLSLELKKEKAYGMR